MPMTDAHSLADAVALHRANRLDEAEAGYRKVIAATGNPDAMQLLATLLHQSGNPREGLTWLERALRHFGDHDGLESNRAAMLLATGQAESALAATESILQRNPTHAGASKNRLLALRALGRDTRDLMEKIRWYELYQEAGGNDPGARLDHANALRRSGQAERALALFQQARAEHPDSLDIASSTLISACFDATQTTETLATLARSIAPLYPGEPATLQWSGDSHVLGFYSPRFADGPMASLVLPVMEELQRRGLRLVLFSRGSLDEPQSKPFREVADAVHAVESLAYEQFAALVERERVSVLFDLCGHSPGNRLADFCRRLAPVQACWGDWFLTTGLPGYDLYIGDAVTNPPAEDHCFSERVLRLPDGRFTYTPPPRVDAEQFPTPQDPVFASFNRLAKLTEPTLDCWADILRRAPGATLLLCSDGLEYESVRRFTTRRFAERGVSAEQTEYLQFMDYPSLLGHYRRVSVALDPFPFNGCVTTFDALAMGVPVVALHGNAPVARQSASILEHLQLGGWVAHSKEEYVEQALRLLEPTNNRAARRQLTGDGASDSFDVAGFTTTLLQALAEAR
tara:strand:- start:50162 stop:51880 length:1719 start_codon:yes stop_codon:yes gene_type:complete